MFNTTHKISMLSRKSTIVTNGLVLYYDAANTNSYPGTGTAWYDLSGNNNTGTLIDGPTYSSSNGGSILFDGFNDVISTPNSASLQLTTGLSLCCWVYIQNTSDGFFDLFTKQSYTSETNNSGYILRVFNGSFSVYGRLDLVLLNNAYNVAYSSENVVSLNTWHYLCGVYTGTQMILYINGTANASFNYSGNARSNTVNLTLGGYSGLTGYNLGGLMSIAQIYNRGLSASEIMINYNSQKGRFGL